MLSRSVGVDLRTGKGLDSALKGADAIIDVTNPGPADRRDANAFFADVARTLQSIGAAHHVDHIVTLSIVGIERAPNSSYYAAKVKQEHVALGGPVPGTVLRATQFHEFPVQILRRNREASSSHVPRMRVQSVAARTTARILVDVASGHALGRAADLAGPEQAELVTLASRYVEHFGIDVTIREVAADPSIPYGATLPGAEARLEGPTFDDWLETDDAALLQFT